MQHLKGTSHRIIPALLITFMCSVITWSGYGQISGSKPPPSFKDVKYGPHERNVLDFWMVDSEKPAPLVIYIHGGGFKGGSKKSLNGRYLNELLESGIAVAAFHYRLVQQAPLPAAHHDCRRAIKFVRYKAKEWNIDSRRIGAFGGSAGAQLCMYLAFHDDMAEPGRHDKIDVQSTRLRAVATAGGQTTMDVEWWLEHIPGYDKPHRDFYANFDTDSREEYLDKVSDVSALSLISPDDPPIYMTYGMAPDDPVPTGSRAQGWKVHHVQFGVALKEKMDALGLEADLVYPGAKHTYRSVPEFFKKKLLNPANGKP